MHSKLKWKKNLKSWRLRTKFHQSLRMSVINIISVKKNTLNKLIEPTMGELLGGGLIDKDLEVYYKAFEKRVKLTEKEEGFLERYREERARASMSVARQASLDNYNNTKYWTNPENAIEITKIKPKMMAFSTRLVPGITA